MRVLANRLRQARRRAGLSQRALAALLHVSQQAVSGWETGYRQPDAEQLPRLAEVLNTSVAYLLGETDDPRPRHDGQHNGQEVSEEDEEEMLRQLVFRLGGTQEDAEMFIQYLRLRRQIEGWPGS